MRPLIIWGEDARRLHGGPGRAGVEAKCGRAARKADRPRARVITRAHEGARCGAALRCPGLTATVAVILLALAADASAQAIAGSEMAERHLPPAAALADASTAIVPGSVRIKDVATLEGTAPIQLVGYGLVIGLNKTGDRRQTIFSAQSLANTLQRFGVTVAPDQIKIENIAAVLVTSELSAFVRPGARLDVMASSIGDARSLQGGTLLATPLRGPDGQVYALAQGALTLGGFGASQGGNSVQVNHLTVGRVPGGALVQQGQQVHLGRPEEIVLALHEPDFITAARMATVVNAELGGDAATVVDPATVTVKMPASFRGSVPELMARVEPLTLSPDVAARVVINERTGTVVVGGGVRLGAAAVAHGNLSVKISEQSGVSQPSPMSQGGSTQVVQQTDVNVDQSNAQLIQLEEGVTLDAVVRTLNTLGVTPRDIIAIMQALKAAGALRAEIVII